MWAWIMGVLGVAMSALALSAVVTAVQLTRELLMEGDDDSAPSPADFDFRTCERAAGSTLRALQRMTRSPQDSSSRN